MLNEIIKCMEFVCNGFISNEEFNYNDDTGRYDPMSASDIMALQSVLCNENIN